MKISYKWLTDYIEIDVSPAELKNLMTFAGIEVEAVENPGESLANIVVGEILSKEQHPDADKLSVCKVSTGGEEIQVVCGAPNCATGQKIAFAPVGTVLGEIKLKKIKLRDVVSMGMICAEDEIGLSDSHDGIMVLADDAVPGTPMADYLGVTDTVYDVEIT
ncbi:MAG: phenylalanine--tRNA ligase subunit beta, partial [Candidatus Cloacimonetes bacterium]|nr:phenylalanine--tRNA ligase subunit beta [Candidatus Cloacimonadota bacterium]